MQVGASAPLAQPQSSCSSWSEPSSAPPPGTHGLCCRPPPSLAPPAAASLSRRGSQPHARHRFEDSFLTPASGCSWPAAALLRHSEFSVSRRFFLKNYLSMAALSLRSFPRVFSTCSERGRLLVACTGSRCPGFSSCRSRALEHPGFSSCGTPAQQFAAHGFQSSGSVTVARGLSCSAACGSFPHRGLTCPESAGRVSPTAPPGKAGGPCMITSSTSYKEVEAHTGSVCCLRSHS